MLRFRTRFETSLAEISLLLKEGWEIYDSDEDGYWLFLET